jgi:HK97 family phage prohead protease
MLVTKTLSINDAQIKMDDGTATFRGYASVFGGVDSYGDTIERGAFQSAIKSGKKPKMFENHKSWELPIGKYISIQEDTNGLFVEGELTPNHAKADMVKAAMRHGTLDGMSIGFRMTKDDYEDTKTGRIIKNVSDLVEISIVTFPADDAARIDLNSVKSELDTIASITDLEAFLREAGGFSKGLAVAVLARSKAIFGGEPQTALDEKAVAELKRLLNLPSL